MVTVDLVGSRRLCRCRPHQSPDPAYKRPAGKQVENCDCCQVRVIAHCGHKCWQKVNTHRDDGQNEFHDVPLQKLRAYQNSAATTLAPASRTTASRSGETDAVNKNPPKRVCACCRPCYISSETICHLLVSGLYRTTAVKLVRIIAPKEFCAST